MGVAFTIPTPEVVGRAGPAHPRGDPAGVDRVAEDVAPEASDGGGEVVTNSLLSGYEPLLWPVQSVPARSARPR
jgi:hypothetical protein